MGIQSSINTALGVAAIASGLTNKKQVDRAQDKLDNSEKNLAKTEENLAKTAAEKDEVINQQAEDAKLDLKAYEQFKNMYSGGKTAKETNVDNAGDKIDVINNNSTNDIKGPSVNDFLNSSQKPDPFAVEQIMGFRALKMLDSRIAAKRDIINRSKSRRTMISDRARAARENGGNE